MSADAKLDEIERLALDLIWEHLPRGWGFTWDQAKRRSGCCDFAIRAISLSRPVFALDGNDLDAARSTILHEIAHALVGPDHGHDATWKRQARALGIPGDRCGDHDAPTGVWRAECEPCEISYERHRLARGYTAYFCGRCEEPIVFTHARTGETRGSPKAVKERRPTPPSRDDDGPEALRRLLSF